MLELAGVPLHPAAAHFPIAASVFGALALLLASVLPPARRGSFSWGASALLLLGALSGLAAALTGHAWADSLGFLKGAGWFPAPSIRSGLAFRHAALALTGTGLSLAAGLLAARTAARRAAPLLALVVALGAAGSLLYAGHAGARMVHVPEGRAGGTALGSR